MNSQTQKFIFSREQFWIPTGRKQNVIESQSAAWDDIQPGDIVIYSGNREHMCRRVLFRRRLEGMLWYFTKNDASLDADGWIPAYRVVGKVIKINRETVTSLKWTQIARLSLLYSRLQWKLFHKFSGPRVRLKLVTFPVFKAPVTP